VRQQGKNSSITHDENPGDQNVKRTRSGKGSARREEKRERQRKKGKETKKEREAVNTKQQHHARFAVLDENPEDRNVKGCVEQRVRQACDVRLQTAAVSNEFVRARKGERELGGERGYRALCFQKRVLLAHGDA
jgi:hypothetical protein